MAILEKAAGQGHAYAMTRLGGIHKDGKEHERAVEWYTKGAEAGLPQASSTSGAVLTRGRAWRRRSTRRRRNGTGARQSLGTGMRRATSPTCTLSAAVGPGR